MTITYELQEEFTGIRTVPPAEEGGESLEVSVNEVMVCFTDTEKNIEHTRGVNVVFNADGEYDHEATLERCEEVARGIAVKIEAGVIK